MRPVILERKDKDASLASWINTAMNALHAADCEGLAGHIHWPAHSCPWAYQDAEAFARCPNMFEWYFEQPRLPVPPPEGSPVWVYEDRPDLIERHPLRTERSFYPLHLRPNATVRARFDALLAQLPLQPARTIAVAWRGTDIGVDGRPRTPITAYFPVIDALLAQEPDLAIVAKPEQQGAADALRQRYPQVHIPAGFFLAPDGTTQMQDRVHPAPGFERGMQAVLLILLLARSKFLLKNSANLADCAARLSRCHIYDADRQTW